MGLDALKRLQQQEADRKASADRRKVEWLSVKENEQVEVVFLQELEAVAEDNVVREWAVNGNGKFKTLVDTNETEGACYAEDVKKSFYAQGLEKTKYQAKVAWKVYFSVVKADDPTNVYAFAQNITSGLVKSLQEDVEEEGGITGVVYRISKGPAKSDSWTIRRLKREAPDVSKAEPYKINEVARFVPLEKQPDYLADLLPQGSESTSEPSSEAPKVDDDSW